jgi:hypothetical protein
VRQEVVLGVCGALLFFSLCLPAAAEDSPLVSFVREPGRIAVFSGGQPLATYVYEDKDILRPYFCAVHALDGTPITRTHPPVEGVDPADHATYHPGLWLAFGDISGADFWRNKAHVKHEKIIQEPLSQPGRGVFAVQNAYRTEDGKIICRETCRYTFLVRPSGWFLLHESEFTSDAGEIVFGDQEEMGLGVRVATPLTVKNGGRIVNSDGLMNEERAWGKQADWCEYSGAINGRRVGVTLMPHPANFGRSWFHARDYGLLVANPFGRNAFTEGDKSAVRVAPGQRLRLRFGAFICSTAAANDARTAAAYDEYLRLAEDQARLP